MTPSRALLSTFLGLLALALSMSELAAQTQTAPVPDQQYLRRRPPASRPQQRQRAVRAAKRLFNLRRQQRRRHLHRHRLNYLMI